MLFKCRTHMGRNLFMFFKCVCVYECVNVSFKSLFDVLRDLKGIYQIKLENISSCFMKYLIFFNQN